MTELWLYHYRAQLVRVVDGDTVDLAVDLGFGTWLRARFRLLGVDTPETYGVGIGSPEHEAGMEAKRYVEEWFARAAGDILVKTHQDKHEKYGRWLAKIWSDSVPEAQSLNDALKAKGWGMT